MRLALNTFVGLDVELLIRLRLYTLVTAQKLVAICLTRAWCKWFQPVSPSDIWILKLPIGRHGPQRSGAKCQPANKRLGMRVEAERIVESYLEYMTAKRIFAAELNRATELERVLKIAILNVDLETLRLQFLLKVDRESLRVPTTITEISRRVVNQWTEQQNAQLVANSQQYKALQDEIAKLSPILNSMDVDGPFRDMKKDPDLGSAFDQIMGVVTRLDALLSKVGSA
jgi:hypothetical protein